MKPPRPIVWSTDRIDLNDPVQPRGSIRQVLPHGRAEDICTLDLAEVVALLDGLNLPEPVYRLWRAFLEGKGYLSATFRTGG